MTSEEQIEKEQGNSADFEDWGNELGEFEDVYQELLKNDRSYTLLKLSEEAMELAEVLLKKVNKAGDSSEPTDKAVVEEMAHVMIRAMAVMELLDPESVIFMEEIDRKLRKLQTEIGKYPGRL